jgi:hypothetical protein
MVQFLKNGGKLLIGPVFPEWDENLEPCTILRDFLGARGKLEKIPDGAFVRLPFSGTIYCSSLALTMPRPARGATVLGRDTTTPGCSAWLKSLPGGGRALWLGLNWTHAMRYHERMLTGCLRKLGLKSVLTCTNPNLWCTLWTHEKDSILFIMNLHVSPQTANVTCQPAWSKTVIGPGNVTVPPMTVKRLSLH